MLANFIEFDGVVVHTIVSSGADFEITPSHINIVILHWSGLHGILVSEILKLGTTQNREFSWMEVEIHIVVQSDW